MKTTIGKIAALVLVLILLLSMAACGGTSPAPSGQDQQDGKKNEAEEQTVPEDEPADGGEDPGEVLAGFMLQYYGDAGLIPRNVLAQELPEGMAEQLEGWLRQKREAR